MSKYAFGKVSPNPMVGSLIVYNQRIIGEGFHQYFGMEHAEVNAVNSVKNSEKFYLPQSTLFISLEPCNFHGKTPACTDLILKTGFKKIFVANLDKTPGIDGQSLKMLESKGIDSQLLEIELPEYNPVRFRNVNAALQRPYIVLKYAASADGFIGSPEQRIKLSNALSDRFVHLLRAHSDAILIGKNTALTDQPLLTTRLVPGRSPVKVLIDPKMEVPLNNMFFSTEGKKFVYNNLESKQLGDIHFIKIAPGNSFLTNVLEDLYQRGTGILLVEGGSKTLTKFAEEELFDEVYEIRTPKILNGGIRKPDGISGLEEIHQFRADKVLRSYVNRI